MEKVESSVRWSSLLLYRANCKLKMSERLITLNLILGLLQTLVYIDFPFSQGVMRYRFKFIQKPNSAIF